MKFATPFIIIAISIAVYFVYISPTIDSVKLFRLQKSEQSNVLLKTREVAAKRDAILVDYNNISASDIDKLNKIVPDTFNPVLFANDISGIASAYGLVMKDFKVNEPKTEIRDAIVNRPKGETYKTTVVTLRLQGQYSQFIKFLANLDLSLRLVDVASLSIKPIGLQNSSSSSLEYLLEMNTYSLIGQATNKDTLTLIEKLKTISIDQNVFSGPMFSSLKDFSQTISPELQGRTNPFALIGSDIFVGSQKIQ